MDQDQTCYGGTMLAPSNDRLARDRVDHGEGCFRQPCLPWFVVENPIRSGKLAADITRITQAVVRVAERRTTTPHAMAPELHPRRRTCCP